MKTFAEFVAESKDVDQELFSASGDELDKLAAGSGEKAEAAKKEITRRANKK